MFLLSFKKLSPSSTNSSVVFPIAETTITILLEFLRQFFTFFATKSNCFKVANELPPYF